MRSSTPCVVSDAPVSLYAAPPRSQPQWPERVCALHPFCSVHQSDSEPIPSPTTIEPWLSTESLQLGLSGPAFEARQSVLEFRLCPAIYSRRDHARLVRATEFRKGFPHNPKRVLRLSNFVLEMDG